jgi:hypothetical protein
LELSYRFKETEGRTPALISESKTDTELFRHYYETHPGLLEIAHVRSLEIENSRANGKPVLALRVAEGPAPWRADPKALELAPADENRPK